MLVGEPSKHAHTIDDPDLFSSSCIQRIIFVLIVVNRWTRLFHSPVQQLTRWNVELYQQYQQSISMIDNGKKRQCCLSFTFSFCIPNWPKDYRSFFFLFFYAVVQTCKQREQVHLDDINIEYFFTLIVPRNQRAYIIEYFCSSSLSFLLSRNDIIEVSETNRNESNYKLLRVRVEKNVKIYLSTRRIHTKE